MAEEYQKYATYALGSEPSGEFSVLEADTLLEEESKKEKHRQKERKEVSEAFCNFFKVIFAPNRPKSELMQFRDFREMYEAKKWQLFLQKCTTFNLGKPIPGTEDKRWGPFSLRLGDKVIAITLTYNKDSDTFAHSFINQKP